MAYGSRSHGVIDKVMIAHIVSRNGLTRLGMSQAIFGGNCPFCGQERSFTLWAEAGIYRCFWCGADGRFVASPERMSATRERRRAMLDEMVV